jgi:hypothetical protein
MEKKKKLLALFVSNSNTFADPVDLLQQKEPTRRCRQIPELAD